MTTRRDAGAAQALGCQIHPSDSQVVRLPQSTEEALRTIAKRLEQIASAYVATTRDPRSR